MTERLKLRTDFIIKPISNQDGGERKREKTTFVKSRVNTTQKMLMFQFSKFSHQAG